LGQVFKLDLDGVDFWDVAILFEFLFGISDVLFLLAEKIESSGVVLEDVGANTETDTSGASCYDEDLWYLASDWFVCIEIDTLPDRSGMSVLGSNVLLLPNMFMVLMDILVWMINTVDGIDQVESRDNVWEVPCYLVLPVAVWLLLHMSFGQPDVTISRWREDVNTTGVRFSRCLYVLSRSARIE
jgi:hypothetical protein